MIRGKCCREAAILFGRLGALTGASKLIDAANQTEATVVLRRAFRAQNGFPIQLASNTEHAVNNAQTRQPKRPHVRTDVRKKLNHAFRPP